MESAFEGQPWYGISLMKKLGSIEVAAVNQQINGSNSIARLILHMIQWRKFALEKLAGNEQFDIMLNSPEDWPTVTITSEQQWNDIVDTLRSTQSQLLQELGQRSDEYFEELTPGKSYTNFALYHGIVQHDIYHLGQVAMLHKQIENQ